MLVVRDPALAAKVPGLRHNGHRGFDDQEAYWKPAMSNLDFDMDGIWPHNFCIGEVQCALGAKLLERLDAVNEERRERAERFMTALGDFPELVFQSTPEGCEHTHHLLAARYDGQPYGRHRDDLMELMAFTYGVKLVVQYYPLNRYPLLAKAGFGEASCPNRDEFFDNMVSFPFQHWMPEDQFEYMIDATRRALTELRQGRG